MIHAARLVSEVETVVLCWPPYPPDPGDFYPREEFGPVRAIRVNITLTNGDIHEYFALAGGGGAVFTTRKEVG